MLDIDAIMIAKANKLYVNCRAIKKLKIREIYKAKLIALNAESFFLLIKSLLLIQLDILLDHDIF